MADPGGDVLRGIDVDAAQNISTGADRPATTQNAGVPPAIVIVAPEV